MMWLFNKSLSYLWKILSMDLILSLGDKHYLIKSSLNLLSEDIRLSYLIGTSDLGSYQDDPLSYLEQAYLVFGLVDDIIKFWELKAYTC